MPGSRYAIQGKDNSGLLGGMMKTGPRASPKAPNHLCYELNVAFKTPNRKHVYKNSCV